MNQPEREAGGISDRTSNVRRLLFTAACGLAGLALNYLNIPILGEETPEFVFGGAPVLLVFAVLGPRYGTLAGLLSLLPMLARFDPAGYATLIYLIEFLTVYWLYTRLHGFVLASVAFWLTAGWLLDLVFYGWGVGLSGDYLALLFFKQILNGAFNALIADGILAAAEPWLHARAGHRSVPPAPLRGFAVRVAMAAVLLPVLAGTIAVTREAYSHTVTQAYNAADVTGSRVAGAIRQSLQQRELEISSLGRQLDSTPASGDPGPGSALQDFLAQHSGFLSVEVTDAEGTILSSAPEALAVGVRLADRSPATRQHFADARDSGSMVWAPLVFGTLHVRDASHVEPVLAVAEPLFDAAGSFRGEVAAAVDMSRLFSIALPASESSSIRVTVLDSKGQVVFTQDPQRRVGAAVAVSVPPAAGDDPEMRRISYYPPKAPDAGPGLGRDRIFAVTLPVRRGELWVLVDVPASWVHASMRSATGRALLWFVLFFGGAALLAVWGTSNMTRRVVGWQTAVEDVAHGRVIAPGVLQRGLQSRVNEVRALSGALAVMDEEVRAEREQAHATVASTEDRLRAIADHTSAVIFMKDVAGRYLFVNRQFEEEAHRTGPACLGKTDDEIFPPAQADSFREHDQAVIQTGRVLEFEEQIPHSDGIHSFWTTLFPLRKESGEIYAIGGIATDHTELRRAAQETAALQAQNQRLQRSESLGRMAGAVAHHFNNQLGAVIGNLELALDDLPRDAASIASLTDAMSAARRAADVSALMLTYIGQTVGTRARIDLADVCSRHVPVLRAGMPAAVVLETNAPSPGPVVRADKNQLHQILSSLVTNAWEAIEEGPGVIRLTVATVSGSEISSTHRFPLDWKPEDESYACLTVADNGCGIADADIEHLFDPFYSSKFTGRGLGLSVVLGIVRSHGGAVTVESDPGRGSVFRVFLPVSAEQIAPQPGGPETPAPQRVPVAAAAAARPAVVPNTAGRATVLLVEDESAVRKMAASMLKHLGFAVVEAKDGVEAVELFRQHQNEVCCVVCDLTMPHMSGWETLSALRAIAPAIPVVLASGYDEASVMAGYHPDSPDAFLGKPFRLTGLSEAIETALNARAKAARA